MALAYVDMSSVIEAQVKSRFPDFQVQLCVFEWITFLYLIVCDCVSMCALPCQTLFEICVHQSSTFEDHLVKMQ